MKVNTNRIIDKFKKASNTRLINWIQKAVSVLKERGVDIRIYQLDERRMTRIS